MEDGLRASVRSGVSVRAGLDTRDDVEGPAQPCVTPQQCVGKVSFTRCGAVECGGGEVRCKSSAVKEY